MKLFTKITLITLLFSLTSVLAYPDAHGRDNGVRDAYQALSVVGPIAAVLFAGHHTFNHFFLGSTQVSNDTFQNLGDDEQLLPVEVTTLPATPTSHTILFPTETISLPSNPTSDEISTEMETIPSPSPVSEPVAPQVLYHTIESEVPEISEKLPGSPKMFRFITIATFTNGTVKDVKEIIGFRPSDLPGAIKNVTSAVHSIKLAAESNENVSVGNNFPKPGSSARNSPSPSDLPEIYRNAHQDSKHKPYVESRRKKVYLKLAALQDTLLDMLLSLIPTTQTPLICIMVGVPLVKLLSRRLRRPIRRQLILGMGPAIDLLGQLNILDWFFDTEMAAALAPALEKVEEVESPPAVEKVEKMAPVPAIEKIEDAVSLPAVAVVETDVSEETSKSSAPPVLPIPTIDTKVVDPAMESSKEELNSALLRIKVLEDALREHESASADKVAPQPAIEVPKIEVAPQLKIEAPKEEVDTGSNAPEVLPVSVENMTEIPDDLRLTAPSFLMKPVKLTPLDASVKKPVKKLGTLDPWLKKIQDVRKRAAAPPLLSTDSLRMRNTEPIRSFVSEKRVPIVKDSDLEPPFVPKSRLRIEPTFEELRQNRLQSLKADLPAPLHTSKKDNKEFRQAKAQARSSWKEVHQKFPEAEAELAHLEPESSSSSLSDFDFDVRPIIRRPYRRRILQKRGDRKPEATNRTQKKAVEKPVQETTVPEEPVQEEAIENRAVEKKAVQESAVPKEPVQEKAIEKKAAQEKTVPEKAVENKAAEKKTVKQEPPIQQEPVQFNPCRPTRPLQNPLDSKRFVQKPIGRKAIVNAPIPFKFFDQTSVNGPMPFKLVDTKPVQAKVAEEKVGQIAPATNSTSTNATKPVAENNIKAVPVAAQVTVPKASLETPLPVLTLAAPLAPVAAKDTAPTAPVNEPISGLTPVTPPAPTTQCSQDSLRAAHIPRVPTPEPEPDAGVGASRGLYGPLGDFNDADMEYARIASQREALGITKLETPVAAPVPSQGYEYGDDDSLFGGDDNLFGGKIKPCAPDAGRVIDSIETSDNDNDGKGKGKGKSVSVRPVSAPVTGNAPRPTPVSERPFSVIPGLFQEDHSVGLALQQEYDSRSTSAAPPRPSVHDVAEEVARSDQLDPLSAAILDLADVQVEAPKPEEQSVPVVGQPPAAIEQSTPVVEQPAVAVEQPAQAQLSSVSESAVDEKTSSNKGNPAKSSIPGIDFSNHTFNLSVPPEAPPVYETPADPIFGILLKNAATAAPSTMGPLRPTLKSRLDSAVAGSKIGGHVKFSSDAMGSPITKTFRFENQKAPAQNAMDSGRTGQEATLVEAPAQTAMDVGGAGQQAAQVQVPAPVDTEPTQMDLDDNLAERVEQMEGVEQSFASAAFQQPSFVPKAAPVAQQPLYAPRSASMDVEMDGAETDAVVLTQSEPQDVGMSDVEPDSYVALSELSSMANPYQQHPYVSPYNVMPQVQQAPYVSPYNVVPTAPAQAEREDAPSPSTVQGTDEQEFVVSPRREEQPAQAEYDMSSLNDMSWNQMTANARDARPTPPSKANPATESAAYQEYIQHIAVVPDQGDEDLPQTAAPVSKAPEYDPNRPQVGMESVERNDYGDEVDWSDSDQDTSPAAAYSNPNHYSVRREETPFEQAAAAKNLAESGYGPAPPAAPAGFDSPAAIAAFGRANEEPDMPPEHVAQIQNFLSSGCGTQPSTEPPSPSSTDDSDALDPHAQHILKDKFLDHRKPEYVRWGVLRCNVKEEVDSSQHPERKIAKVRSRRSEPTRTPLAVNPSEHPQPAAASTVSNVVTLKEPAASQNAQQDDDDDSGSDISDLNEEERSELPIVLENYPSLAPSSRCPR